MVGRKETKQKLGYNVALRSQEMMGIGASYQNNTKEGIGIDYDNKSTQLRFTLKIHQRLGAKSSLES